MNKKQILIVDDKEQIAKILYAYLQADYDCHYVQNPLHAIKRLLAGHMPDLIISDIRMPEMRGDEFLEYLKHNELFKQIPGRDAFERGQHLGTHPPAGRGRGGLHRQTVQPAGAQNTH